MKEARLRALTLATDSFESWLESIEMKEARLRALTHSSISFIKDAETNRNERSPFKGIDTLKSTHEGDFTPIEMKEARLRALTH